MSHDRLNKSQNLSFRVLLPDNCERILNPIERTLNPIDCCISIRIITLQCTICGKKTNFFYLSNSGTITEDNRLLTIRHRDVTFSIKINYLVTKTDKMYVTYQYSKTRQLGGYEVITIVKSYDICLCYRYE